MGTVIVQLFLTIIPCIVVGLIAYNFFKNYVADQDSRRLYELKKKTKKETIPYRIQALERLVLFMERIDPRELLIRIKPATEDKGDYVRILVEVIEQEYHHNVAQQIYVSEKCWKAIKTSKNATINLIRNTADEDGITLSEELRHRIFVNLETVESPSEIGIQFIKQEAKELW